MSTFTGQSKSSDATFTNDSSTSVTLYGIVKSGQAQPYDSSITYDGVEPWGRPVKYDSVGTDTSFTNVSKS